MKTCFRCKVEQPLTEFYVYQGRPHSYCKQCVCAEKKAYRLANPEKCKARTKSWQQRNQDKVRESSRRARERKPEQSKAATRKWYASNRNKRLETLKAWSKANRDKTAAYWAAYKSRKMNATPAWVERQYIENMYVCARLCTEATGIRYHVDHIVPLCSDIVCGLHVPENLQVIPGSLNMSKSNYYWPDMP